METLRCDKHRYFKELAFTLTTIILIYSIYIFKIDGGFNLVNISSATCSSLTVISILLYNRKQLASMITLLVALIIEAPALGGMSNASIGIMLAEIGCLVVIARLVWMKRSGKIKISGSISNRLDTLVNSRIKPIKISTFHTCLLYTVILSILLQLASNFDGGELVGIGVMYKFEASLIYSMPLMVLLITAINSTEANIIRFLCSIIFVKGYVVQYMENPANLDFMFLAFENLLITATVVYSMLLGYDEDYKQYNYTD